MTDKELYDEGILGLSLKLHMSLNGSSDPLSGDEEKEIVIHLQQRVREWRNPSSDFDRACLAMMRAVIREYLRSLGFNSGTRGA